MTLGKISPKEHPRLTVLGGGTGLPVLLAGLKRAAFSVSAIVTVADDGGSSGSIRSSIKTIPPGDIRNCLVALSALPPIYKDIFQYRFALTDQEFSGHTVGNLLIAAVSEMQGDVYQALTMLGELMKVQGTVLPASEQALCLRARFQDGVEVEGETAIVARRQPIERVSVSASDAAGQPIEPRAGRGVVDAIMDSDMIILGPGSLYTSILPNICIPEIRQALLKTKAPLVYLVNIMTQLGETEHFSDADHVRVIHQHLGKKALNAVLLNNKVVPKAYIHRPDSPDYLVQVSHDAKGLAEECDQIFQTDLLDLKPQGVYHDQQKLVRALLNYYEELC